MPESFRDLLARGAPRDELAAAADALSSGERVVLVRSLGAAALARLWALAEGGPPLTLEFFVPTTTSSRPTADWVGKNSLPLFSHFSKRFAASALPSALVGHNHGSMEWLVGPGYFTATVRPGVPGEFLFDYTRYPEAAPPGWPKLRPNERGVSRLVFKDMHDYFRPVGGHLGIGAAFDKSGKFKGQYFALTRGAVLPMNEEGVATDISSRT